MTMSNALAVQAWGDSSVVQLSLDEQRTLARRILDAWETEPTATSPHTLRAKRSDLAAFGRFHDLEAEDDELRELAAGLLLFGGFTEAHHRVRRWLSWMGALVKVIPNRKRKGPRHTARTAARRLAHLRGLVRVAQEHGLPWGLMLRGPKISREDRRDAMGPEAWKVYGVIAELAHAAAGNDEDPRPARDAAVLQLLFVLGLRRESVAELNVEDIRDGRVWLYVKGKKNQIGKTLPRSTQAAIRLWMEWRGDEEPGRLFTGVREGDRDSPLTGNQVYRICVSHKLGNPHGLRHSGANKLAREGKSVFDVQAHLGHASTQTAQHYVTLAADLPGKVSAYLAEELDELYDA